MFMYPELTMALAREHRREMIADAERSRLLTLALRHRSDARRGGPVRNVAVRGRPTDVVAAPGRCVVAAR